MLNIQVAFDGIELSEQLSIARTLRLQKCDILEIGTPLLMHAGVQAIASMRAAFPETPICADLKAIDLAVSQVDKLFGFGVNYVTLHGLLEPSQLAMCVDVARAHGGYLYISTIGLTDALILEMLVSWAEFGDRIIPIAHGEGLIGQDAFSRAKSRFRLIRSHWERMIAFGGGVTPLNAAELRNIDVDFLIVGRGICADPNPPAALDLIRIGAAANSVVT